MNWTKLITLTILIILGNLMVKYLGFETTVILFLILIYIEC